MNSIRELYRELKARHGKPAGQWALWCKRPKTLPEKELMVIEAILTQRANWKNVQLAVDNLQREDCRSLATILKMPEEALAPLIRPSGFYAQKARRLKVMADFFLHIGGVAGTKKMPTGELREKLLALHGVGPETADDILLYALERPVFVIDEYTRRLAKAKKLSKDIGYHALQKLFEKNIRKDYRLYQDFHALIVIDGKAG